MCAAYGRRPAFPNPIKPGRRSRAVRGSLMITRPVLSHYVSNRSEIDAAAKSPVRCRRTGVVVASNVVKTLSASGGCGRAQVHRRTQDNGLDRHASFRVSGPRIMSIKRHEIRQISDENRWSADHQPGSRSRQRRVPGRHHPDPIVGDIKTRLLKCCDASMSFSNSREPTNHNY